MSDKRSKQIERLKVSLGLNSRDLLEVMIDKTLASFAEEKNSVSDVSMIEMEARIKEENERQFSKLSKKLELVKDLTYDSLKCSKKTGENFKRMNHNFDEITESNSDILNKFDSQEKNTEKLNKNIYKTNENIFNLNKNNDENLKEIIDNMGMLLTRTSDRILNSIFYYLAPMFNKTGITNDEGNAGMNSNVSKILRSKAVINIMKFSNSTKEKRRDILEKISDVENKIEK
jgi:hypothetical protein